MQHQVSANGRSVINSGITEDYKQAFVEYIWNGFDAGATEINISYVQANELGALESVCVSLHLEEVLLYHKILRARM